MCCRIFVGLQQFMCQFYPYIFYQRRRNCLKFLYSSVFICPLKRYHVGHMSQFDNFLNGASTMLNSVLIFLRSLVFINGFLPLTYEERKRVITPLTIIFFYYYCCSGQLFIMYKLCIYATLNLSQRLSVFIYTSLIL